MFRVFTCPTEQHDWQLVLLAGLVCFLSSLVAISLFRRAGATRGRARAAWIATAIVIFAPERSIGVAVEPQ